MNIGRVIFVLATSLCITACGGGGGGDSSTAGSPTPPPGPTTPSDPTATAEWATLVSRLDTRYTTNQQNLEAEQAADSGPLGGNYYARARDRFIFYSDLFWSYSYDETVRLSNASSLTFRQSDVSALLDDYRSRWLTYVSVFVNNLPNDPGGNVLASISAEMREAVNSGYNSTLDRLKSWLIQSILPPAISAIQGSWNSTNRDVSLSIEPSGSVLGYDTNGCQYEGLVVTNAWLQSDIKVIMERKCGTAQQIVSGVVFMDSRDAERFIQIDAAAESLHLNLLLTR